MAGFFCLFVLPSVTSKLPSTLKKLKCGHMLPIHFYSSLTLAIYTDIMNIMKHVTFLTFSFHRINNHVPVSKWCTSYLRETVSEK